MRITQTRGCAPNPPAKASRTRGAQPASTTWSWRQALGCGRAADVCPPHGRWVPTSRLLADLCKLSIAAPTPLGVPQPNRRPCRTMRFSSSIVAMVVPPPHSFWGACGNSQLELQARMAATSHPHARPTSWPPGRACKMAAHLEHTEQLVGCPSSIARCYAAGHHGGHVADRRFGLTCQGLRAKLWRTVACTPSQAEPGKPEPPYCYHMNRLQ